MWKASGLAAHPPAPTRLQPRPATKQTPAPPGAPAVLRHPFQGGRGRLCPGGGAGCPAWASSSAASWAAAAQAPAGAAAAPAPPTAREVDTPAVQVTPPVAPQAVPGNGLSNGARSPDDIVVVAACRTACCKAKKGGFKDTPPDELVAAVLKETVRRGGIQPEEVGDVCMGSVFPPSSKRANECRQALLAAGFPASVPVYTVNRQCAAGLQAIADVAASIKAGYYDIGIAGGVEHMTVDPLNWTGSTSPRIDTQDALDVLLPLGITAENVAQRFGVSRPMEDALAAASHVKAAAAQAAGKFRDEIVPIQTVWRDFATGEERSLLVDRDDTIRPDTTPESLSKLKPCFQKGGSVTAGNSCQNTDAAAAVLLMRRSEAQLRGLPILATMKSFATVGVPPSIMGTAPVLAIPKAIHRAGLTPEDIDVYELNEAFASQTAHVCQVLGLPDHKVNPNGGAIALGHPAGATGVRLVVTLIHELARRNKSDSDHSRDRSSCGRLDVERKPKRGVVSLCTGAGMGAAAVFEQEWAGLAGRSLPSEGG